jgi:hypothetical protein
MKKLALITTLALTLIASARADLIGLVGFTGEFTTNHLYDFNNPGAQPFGTFHLETVCNVSGIFSGHVSVGEILGGAGILNTVSSLPLFSLNGLQFVTFSGVELTGGMAGLSVYGNMNIIGLNETFNSALWAFDAPPLDFGGDITGPITLQFRAFSLPDHGSTVMLMGLGLVGVLFLQRRYAFHR